MQDVVNLSKEKKKQRGFEGTTDDKNMLTIYRTNDLLAQWFRTQMTVKADTHGSRTSQRIRVFFFSFCSKIIHLRVSEIKLASYIYLLLCFANGISKPKGNFRITSIRMYIAF